MALSGLPSQPVVIVMGSRNRKKCREMAALIAPPWEPSRALARLEIRSVDDFANAPEVVEDAETFAGNARKKASELARAAVAVGDRRRFGPGRRRARWCARVFSPRAMPASRATTRPIIASCSKPWPACPTTRRGAAFRCALALADPAGTIRLEAAGSCRGLITHEPRGRQGFGYDPLFLIPEYHKTFGELSPLVKHQLSHRARAFGHLRHELERMIGSGGLG